MLRFSLLTAVSYRQQHRARQSETPQTSFDKSKGTAVPLLTAGCHGWAVHKESRMFIEQSAKAVKLLKMTHISTSPRINRQTGNTKGNTHTWTEQGTNPSCVKSSNHLIALFWQQQMPSLTAAPTTQVFLRGTILDTLSFLRPAKVDSQTLTFSITWLFAQTRVVVLCLPLVCGM